MTGCENAIDLVVLSSYFGLEFIFINSDGRLEKIQVSGNFSKWPLPLINALGFGSPGWRARLKALTDDMKKHEGIKHNPLSAGIVVVRIMEGTPRYLLLRVYGYWDFPKGLVEEGEEPLQAALREVEEETTLTGLYFRWGYDFRETAPYGKYNKIARYYLAESKKGRVELPVNPELGHPEHDEFRWLTFDEAKSKVAKRVGSILEWADKLVVS